MKNPFAFGQPEPVIDVLADAYVLKCIELGAPGDALLTLCRAARRTEDIALRYKCSDKDNDQLKDALVLAFMAGQSVAYQTSKNLVPTRAALARLATHKDSKVIDEVIMRCARQCWRTKPKAKKHLHTTARLIRGPVQAALRGRGIDEIEVSAIQKRLARLTAEAT